MSHTPGPWKWDSEGTRGFPVLYGGTDGGRAVLGLDPGGQRLYLSHNEPDARLIAAAPELLEALKWIASQKNLFFAECSQAEEIVSRAELAVAKAEGKTR